MSVGRDRRCGSALENQIKVPDTYKILLRERGLETKVVLISALVYQSKETKNRIPTRDCEFSFSPLPPVTMAACDSVPTTCPLTPVMIASTEWGIVAHHQDFYKALFMIKKKKMTII